MKQCKLVPCSAYEPCSHRIADSSEFADQNPWVSGFVAARLVDRPPQVGSAGGGLRKREGAQGLGHGRDVGAEALGARAIVPRDRHAAVVPARVRGAIDEEYVCGLGRFEDLAVLPCETKRREVLSDGCAEVELRERCEVVPCGLPGVERADLLLLGRVALVKCAPLRVALRNQLGQLLPIVIDSRGPTGPCAMTD